MMALLLPAALALSLMAQNADAPKKADEKGADEGKMMAMMVEMAKPGANHKRLQDTAGTWAYTVKWWMSPEAPPTESSGTAVIKSVMGGRYVIGEHTGTMQMPGPDGKMTSAEFKGMSVEGYDNARQKFVASWIDNLGTGIMNLEGTYDDATRTLTYRAEYEMMPGMKTRLREVIKAIDKDHRTIGFFEDRGGKEVRTMEISYTRKS